MSFADTLPDFSNIKKKSKKALTQDDCLIRKKRILELFISALDLPYEKELIKAMNEIEFKHYGRLKLKEYR